MILMQTKQLTKRFGGLCAVNEINLEIRDGEILGIIGPNGAGKTTLFNLITAHLKQTSGQVYFAGKDISHHVPEKIARLGIARTFQNIKLFRYLDVMENVKTGFHTQTKTHMVDAILHTKRFRDEEKRIEQLGRLALEQVGLERYTNELAGNLSYGLQRRLEIARALALSPRLLLLDEPAAGMNPYETADLMNCVRKIHESGITVVVIEHDMKFIMNLCDRIFVMNSGMKLAEGNPMQITKNSKVIEAYLGSGLSVERRNRKEVIPSVRTT